MELDQPVKDISFKPGMTVPDLVSQMHDSGGFTAKNVGLAADLLRKMVEDDDCTVFLSFPACITATGTRGVIKHLAKEKMVDIVITTCGTLDHDLARVWRDYYHGSFNVDDEKLYDEGVNRLGNVFIPNESYGIILENKMKPVLQELWETGKKEWSTRELAMEFGKRVDDEDSILYWCAKNDIPVYVPGITDGAFGSQLWMFRQEHSDFKVDLFRDEQELSDLVFTAKKTGALMVGGGISKHHVIWWNQYRDGLDYAVYITTAVEHDGSLSGARVREAVSWGKVRKDARFVTVDGDATVMLPLIVGAVV
jgi:deoxyhypusine synthase